MNLLQKLQSDKKLEHSITTFLEQYGIIGLEQALEFYIDMQQEYICKNKTSISKIKIYDIFYLKIQKHNITIYTDNTIYHKYGTLNHELKLLSQYKFMKCSQNCIVSLKKVKTIYKNDIILINNTKIHMSRRYAPKVIIAFSNVNSL